ncbi:MAG: diguanylate cyclase [Actinobacteria bacterium]|nr:diguanylate cyclase [Actinomycetota bacterium]
MRRLPAAVGMPSPADRFADAPRAARIYVIAVEIVAAAGFVAGVAAIGPGRIATMLSRPDFYLFAALIAIADMYPLVPWMRDTRGRIRLHFSGAFALALVLVCGPPALVVFPLIALTSQSSMPTARWRRIVNIAVLTLEGLAGYGALHLVVGSWPQSPSAAQLLIGGGAVALAWEVVNVTAVSGAITLTAGTPFWVTVRLGARRTAPWLTALVAAPMIADIVLHTPLFVPPVALLTILIHRTVALTIRSAADARVDHLTGLANRTAALEELDGRLRPGPGGAGAALMMIDLDGFKAVNDTYGHDTGDRVLAEIAKRLRAAIPPGPLVARIGGDEFVVIADSSMDCAPMKTSVRTAVRAPIRVGASARPDGDVPADGAAQEAVIELDCSIGFVSADGDCEPMAMLRSADRRMYEAKASQASRAAGCDGEASRSEIRYRSGRRRYDGEKSDRPLVDSEAPY